MNVFNMLMPTNTKDEKIIDSINNNVDEIQHPQKKKEEEELEINLNLNDYDYFELLSVFKVKLISNNEDLVRLYDVVKKIEESCIDNEGNISKQNKQIIIFYKKAFKIIEVINLIYDCNLDKYKDYYKIKNQYDTLKKIQNFYKIDTDQLIKQLANIRKIDENDRSTVTEDLSHNIKNNPLEKTTEIIRTFPNPVNKGSINYLERRTQSLTLNMNTTFRDKYYMSDPCDFLYLLPETIKNVVSLKLASIEIPNTWFLLNHRKLNNYFTIEFHTCCEVKHFKIVIPNGNYNHTSLEEYLNHYYFYLNTEFDAEEDGYWIQYLKFTIHPITFHSSFELLYDKMHADLKNDDNLSLTFRFSDETKPKHPIYNTLGWTLGFRLGSYIKIKEKIISEALFDGGGDRYIYFSLNDYQYNNNGNNIVVLSDGHLDEHILAKIPMIDGKLNLIIDENDNLLNKKRLYNGPVDISRFYIKIMDAFGQIIDLNKMDFSFSIELEILYEKF